MRCARAQRLMAAAVDGELRPREQEALESHLATCPPCTAEMTATRTVLGAVGGLEHEATVPVVLEQRTLRRMREVAAAPAVRRWWAVPAVSGLALAATVVVALSFGLLHRSGQAPAAPASSSVGRVARATPQAVHRRTAVARAQRQDVPPVDPPPELAAAPDLFVDLPILRNMEKLEHFEAIRTTTLDGPPAVDGQDASNG
jgi:anti-sigma factor RsiW